MTKGKRLQDIVEDINVMNTTGIPAANTWDGAMNWIVVSHSHHQHHHIHIIKESTSRKQATLLFFVRNLCAHSIMTSVLAATIWVLASSRPVSNLQYIKRQQIR